MRRQNSTPGTWVVMLIAALTLSVPLGCASGPDLEEMEYADQAEYLYRQGEEALERGRYIEATEQFNTVRNEYPYSRWASMANLGIADAYFEQEQFASAVQQYRGFVQLYPNHEDVEYARWRVALAFYEQMPSDFFIFPPPHERDLSTTRDAVRELQIFLREFDESQYAERAQLKWRESMRRLANHEYYVADHYMGEENPVAAIQRLQYLLDNFTGLGLDAEALFLLGEAYLQLGDWETAQTVWNDLIEYHPDHPRAADAEAQLMQQ